MARGRWRHRWGWVVALTVLWLFSGVIPIWQYVDAHAVPSGATTAPATVVGFDRGPHTSARNTGLSGKIARVELTDGSTDTLYLDSRLNYPEEGDTVEVYTADGDLHSPVEASLAQLLVGIVATVLWPALGIFYQRARRRGTAT